MMLLIFITVAFLLASTEATPIEECVEQPIYGENCTVFTDEDCNEINERYPVACEFLRYSRKCLLNLINSHNRRQLPLLHLVPWHGRGEWSKRAICMFLRVWSPKSRVRSICRNLRKPWYISTRIVLRHSRRSVHGFWVRSHWPLQRALNMRGYTFPSRRNTCSQRYLPEKLREYHIGSYSGSMRSNVLPRSNPIIQEWALKTNQDVLQVLRAPRFSQQCNANLAVALQFAVQREAGRTVH